MLTLAGNTLLSKSGTRAYSGGEYVGFSPLVSHGLPDLIHCLQLPSLQLPIPLQRLIITLASCYNKEKKWGLCSCLFLFVGVFFSLWWTQVLFGRHRFPFWITGDVSSGFQSHCGQPIHTLVEAYIIYNLRDSSLELHLLTS